MMTSPIFPAADITPFAPAAYKDLVWQIFFASRNRGMTLETHFPWLESGQAYFVTMTSATELVAGLAVKRVPCRSRRYVAGVVGMVCVHPLHRGRGHSGTLMQAAIDHARALGIDDLVLWTGKPGVYRKLGFMPGDSACFGTVADAGARSARQADTLCAAWPDGAEKSAARGLPPFATAAQRWSNARAAIIVMQVGAGPVLAEWEGADGEVCDLLAQVMPGRWSINALETDTLPAMLRQRGMALDLAPSGLQMMLNLTARQGPADPYQLRILDRI